jgi:AhpD family alkylhydroperoxidase
VEAYLAFGSALQKGLLPASLQEQIALTVAEANACDYCLSAHTALGRAAGLSSDALAASREGRASEPRPAAALQFARAIVDRRGAVTDHDVARVRAAGFSDGEIAEIIAHVGLNVFTNYFNRAVHTEIDFPLVTAGRGANEPRAVSAGTVG